MKKFKKVLYGILILLFAAYLAVLCWFYIYQEQLIFRPDTLPPSHRFSFSIPFEEITIPAEDGAQLHGLLFGADSAKGFIFYLHGNRGALDRWGNRAGLFIELGFDVFMLDYRGFGKSTGVITSEEQFMDDVSRAYEEVSERYEGMPSVVTGYSLGSGPAAYLAQKYQADLLILMAPYFSLTDLSSQLYPFLPSFIGKYEFATSRYLKQYLSKVVIFHGDNDHLINISASERLSRYFTADDTLIVLNNQGHGGIYRNETYRREIAKILKTVR